MRAYLAIVAILFATLLAACSSGSTASTPDSLPLASSAAPTTSAVPVTEVEPSTTTSTSTTTASLVEVTENFGPGTFDLLDGGDPPGKFDRFEFAFEAAPTRLLANAGTTGEFEFWIAIPDGWTFDPAARSFGGGDNRLELFSSCEGECRSKPWPSALESAGGWFHQQQDLGRSRGGSSSSGVTGGYVRSTFDLANGGQAAAAYHMVYAASHFLGCTIAVEATLVDQDYAAVCESVVVDWDSLIERTTPAEPIVPTSSPALAALLEAGVDKSSISTDVAATTVVLDDDETVTMLLPPDADIDVDNFGTAIELDTPEIEEFEIDETCGGLCEATDWEAKLNSFGGTLGKLRPQLDVENDAPLPDDTGWVLSGPVVDPGPFDGEYQLLVVKWNDTARTYFECSASFREVDKQLVTDLLGMCLSAEPNWLAQPDIA